MFPAPKNPVIEVLERQSEFRAKPRKNANVGFAQTRRPRPLLKSSRLEEEGACRCIVNLSIELQERTVSSARAKQERVICLYQPS